MALILTVDDEPDVLFLLRVIFERAGHRVMEAPHGQAALEAIQDQRPDVIVTDLMMPVMDGRELLENLKADPQTASIPVIMLTANPNGAIGADIVMRKPFSNSEIVESVEALASGS
ncbi:MAG TPA: response regulator [Actinomycetota bacterium]|nr:response regulator [Actinomycetota bacterium]